MKYELIFSIFTISGTLFKYSIFCSISEEFLSSATQEANSKLLQYQLESWTITSSHTSKNV
ncbi:MAG: hypothetical protein LBQ59_01840 [Candidatus Peribacteria bacterium]|nr:hypothetical protein [Candidatus Peribacteria bacterium]